MSSISSKFIIFDGTLLRLKPPPMIPFFFFYLEFFSFDEAVVLESILSVWLLVIIEKLSRNSLNGAIKSPIISRLLWSISSGRSRKLGPPQASQSAYEWE
jgi:hypothetical protein